MTEYGQTVAQGAGIAGGSGHSGAAPMGDVGASLGASFSNALDSASAALGVPPTVLIAAALILLFLVLYLRFAR